MNLTLFIKARIRRLSREQIDSLAKVIIDETNRRDKVKKIEDGEGFK